MWCRQCRRKADKKLTATVRVVADVIVGVGCDAPGLRNHCQLTGWCICLQCNMTQKAAKSSHNVWKELVTNQQEHILCLMTIWSQYFPPARLQLHRAAAHLCSFLGDLPWVHDRQQGQMEPKDGTTTHKLTPSGLVALQMTGLAFMMQTSFFLDNIVCLWGDFSNWAMKTQMTLNEVGPSRSLISCIKSKI